MIDKKSYGWLEDRIFIKNQHESLKMPSQTKHILDIMWHEKSIENKQMGEKTWTCVVGRFKPDAIEY